VPPPELLDRHPSHQLGHAFFWTRWMESSRCAYLDQDDVAMEELEPLHGVMVHGDQRSSISLRTWSGASGAGGRQRQAAGGRAASLTAR
jgi:hypothetical protein